MPALCKHMLIYIYQRSIGSYFKNRFLFFVRILQERFLLFLALAIILEISLYLWVISIYLSIYLPIDLSCTRRHVDLLDVWTLH